VKGEEKKRLLSGRTPFHLPQFCEKKALRPPRGSREEKVGKREGGGGMIFVFHSLSFV